MMSEIARELDEQAADMGFADRFECEQFGYKPCYTRDKVWWTTTKELENKIEKARLDWERWKSEQPF